MVIGQHSVPLLRIGGTAFQRYNLSSAVAVARLKIQTVYGKQSRKCTILMQTIIFIITDFGIHIICLAQGYRTPPPAVSFQ